MKTNILEMRFNKDLLRLIQGEITTEEIVAKIDNFAKTFDNYVMETGNFEELNEDMVTTAKHMVRFIKDFSDMYEHKDTICILVAMVETFRKTKCEDILN